MQKNYFYQFQNLQSRKKLRAESVLIKKKLVFVVNYPVKKRKTTDRWRPLFCALLELIASNPTGECRCTFKHSKKSRQRKLHCNLT